MVKAMHSNHHTNHLLFLQQQEHISSVIIMHHLIHCFNQWLSHQSTIHKYGLSYFALHFTFPYIIQCVGMGILVIAALNGVSKVAG
jgi:hypothetical protein